MYKYSFYYQLLDLPVGSNRAVFVDATGTNLLFEVITAQQQ